ncbi:hypothetical protein AB4Z54_47175, partial [Streptomyces sp. MCAF7]
MIAVRRRARARRRALADIQRRVLDAEPGEELLRLVVRRAREAMGADAARVLVAEPAGGQAVGGASGTDTGTGTGTADALGMADASGKADALARGEVLT